MTADCRLQITAALCLLGTVLAGCRQSLETDYGRQSGPGATTSINGTAVFAGMFEQAGHRVTSWQTLSPRLKQRADCIVWFPDDFHGPSRPVRAWLEAWLRERPDRTLIYVGRDFDAEPWYWSQLKAAGPAEEAPVLETRRAAAQKAFEMARAGTPPRDECDWFVLENEARPRKVNTLDGDPEWLDGIDPSGLEMELVGRVASEDAEVLLESADPAGQAPPDVLVSRLEMGRLDSQLIVVANGSFLLNAPLVNHEHRKLAGKLIDAVGERGRNVVFLESSRGGPPIRESDPKSEIPTGLGALNYYPTNWILLHFAAVGIILCFWRWPIFGRPVPPDPPGASDFGKHVEAVAALLRRSRDRGYALSRLKHYQQTVKKES